ncbi:MAG: hypothetical protein ACE5OZ_16755 [Candidatus Heimdallarchaeota archaeon]
MNSKLSKYGLLAIFSLFLLSMGSGVAISTPVRSVPMAPTIEADPIPGETHIYNITSAEFPLDVALDQEGIAVTGTFAGSKIYLKILRDETSAELPANVFQTGMFFTLGSDLDVTFQPNFPNYTDIPSTLREITIPEGLAVPMGEQLSWVAGSGFWPENNDSENEDDYFFIPFYAENFDILAAVIESEGGTTIENSDSVLTVSWEDEDEGVSLEMTWRKTDGLLTKFSIEVTDGSQTIKGTAEHIGTEDRPLPSALSPGSTHTFLVENAELDIEVNDLLRSLLSGDQSDPDYEPFNEGTIEQEVNSMDGKTIMEFEVNSIDGVFYNGTPKVYDPETDNLTTLASWVVIDGFTGNIWDASDDAYDDDSSSALLQEEEEGPLDLPGFTTPAVTPDWEMWSGAVNGIGTLIGEELLAFLRSSDFEDLLLEGMQGDEDSLPITNLDYKVDIGVEWTTENSVHYASAFADFSGAVEVNDADSGLKVNVEVDAYATGWVAFQDSGILAGAGVSGYGDVYGKMESGGLEGTAEGSVNVFEIKIKNTAVTGALDEPANPGGERHPEEDTAEDTSAISGFTFLWILLPLVFLPVFLRKRLK